MYIIARCSSLNQTTFFFLISYIQHQRLRRLRQLRGQRKEGASHEDIAGCEGSEGSEGGTINERAAEDIDN
jgi:hypothetical protein